MLRVQRGAHSEGFGRSRGGFTSKIHARCDKQGVLSVLSSQEARSRIIKPQTLDGVAGSKPQGHAG
ncbi:hypothetical protein PT277_04595 [Acetobacteraceae bacterium ESL0709]|nr:hypothetical protein [Acetobacteraceae bacterium ESL0697]MDF7677974.1 hypothetical protein [Acetobacteraceae bacterium ESL0709]